MTPLAPLSAPRAAEPQTEAAASPRAAAAPGPAETAADTPNPTMRLDPALGLVVLEFREQHGRTETLPTQRELAAYRKAREHPTAPSPPAAQPSGRRDGTAGA